MSQIRVPHAVDDDKKMDMDPCIQIILPHLTTTRQSGGR